MIDDMTARRFKEKVQKDYVRRVRTFAAFSVDLALTALLGKDAPGLSATTIARLN